jgi:branched-chain amino acid transport system permease protein
MRATRISWILFAGLICLAPLTLPTSLVTIIAYTGIYALVAIGLVILTGIGGMTSFGQAAFVGVGAYATAYCSGIVGLSPWLGLVLGAALACVIAFVLGLITLRLAGHYLPLSTIAWGLSLYFLLGNLNFLGGHSGLGNLPVITIFSFPLNTVQRMLYLIWLCVFAALLLVGNLLSSRQGRAIRCLKGGRLMGESMGVDIPRTKAIVFMIAALLAAVAGWLYAHLQLFVSPIPFGLDNGIEYLFMAVVGGAGYLWGGVLGAGLITFLREGLVDFAPNLFGQSGGYDVILLAVATLVILRLAPEGLWPRLVARFVRKKEVFASLHGKALVRRPMPKPGAVLLEVHGAGKQFGGLTALEDVSLRVHAGEIVALLGPNGAGKSTMFNLISGVLEPSHGEIRFLGRNVSDMAPHEIARLGMSRTFQHVKLLPQLSALENVAIGSHLRGRAGVLRTALHSERQEESQLLSEAMRQLERVGMQSHAFMAAGTLPLGEQRILEIARALAADPCLLLLDEPAAGLRFKEKEALGELLRRLRDEGLGVLLVEHDMDFVMKLVDRAVVMDFGRNIAEGLPHEIQNDPLVLEAYLGSVE